MGNSRRDDESFRSGDPGRSTAANSIMSRRGSASGNSSTTNISSRRPQQTPGDRSGQASYQNGSASYGHNPDQNSIEGQAEDFLQKKLREARDAQQTAKHNEHSAGKGRVRKLADEGRGTIKSSPKTPMNMYARDDVESSVSGSLGAKAHGVKMDQLQKEVFDLKLQESFRREKIEKLEVRAERLKQERDEAFADRDAAVKERDEVNAVNTKLCHDINLRDEAIYQAAVKITQLESELQALYGSSLENLGLRPKVSTDTNREDEYNNGILPDLKSSPPQKLEYSGPPAPIKSSSTPMQPLYEKGQSGNLVRMPSFLSDQDPETGALRAMFMPREQSVGSLPGVYESDGGYEQFGERTLNSPRLSIISQSSLLSVYAAKEYEEPYHRQTDRMPLDLESRWLKTKKGLTKSSSIKQWAGDVADGGGVDNNNSRSKERQRETTSPAGDPRKPGTSAQNYITMDEILSKPPLSMGKLQHMMEKKNVPQIVKRERQRYTEARTSDSSPSFQAQVRNFRKTDHRDANSFGGGRALPPTPDTFSTNTLQHVNPSNDTLNSSTYRTPRKVPSFDDNKDKRRSRMGNALFNPTLDPEFADGKRLRRPRSYTETITSRREGHGWDTATQSEQTVTETHSDFSSEAASKGWNAARPMANYAAFNPPDMFNFASPEKSFDPRKDEWDISSDLKTPSKGRTTALGRRDQNDVDRTPTKSRPRERAASVYSADTARRQSYVGPATGNSPYRAVTPPARRSSLAATPSSNEKRRRRLFAEQDAARVQFLMSPSPLKPAAVAEPLLSAAQLLPPPIEQPKKGLLQRFGFRNVTNPQLFNRGGANKEKENKQLEEERSTPPPIMRRSKAEQARRDAAARHLRPHGSSPQTNVDRPATSHGDHRRAVTLGSNVEQRASLQPQADAERDSHDVEGDEMDKQKEAEADSTKGGKKWGFSLGNRTLRRK